MFTPDQQRVLRANLAPARVFQREGQSYLAAWDVRAHLTRLFGYGGWDFHVRDITCADHWATHNDEGQPSRFWATYRCTGSLTVFDGERYCTYEDAAVGEARNQKSSGAAHDLALKSAVSGALKRCAVNLGTQFGLSLYAGTTQDVVRKLVSDESTDLEVHPVEADDIEGGEYA